MCVNNESKKFRSKSEIKFACKQIKKKKKRCKKMKFLLIFMALVACTLAYDVELLNEEQWKQIFEDESKLFKK